MLGSRIEEQERMIELVRQGACKRVLQELDKKAVRKMRPEQVSRLLSALIPFRSRPAREIEELVFRNGRWSWTEKDDTGRACGHGGEGSRENTEKRGGRFRPLFCMGGISGLPAGQVPAPTGEKYAGKRFLFAAAPKSWQNGS